QQLLLALIEFVIADGGDLESHHRQRFDRELIMKQGREERAGADQVAGGDKNRVVGALAELLYQRRHLLGAAGLHRDLFALVAGIGDPDPARRRLKVAVEIVDREDSQVDRRGLRFGARRGLKRQRQHQSCEDLAKRMSHEFTRSVMAGLRPGHPRPSCLKCYKDVDARHKAGHDELCHKAPFHQLQFESNRREVRCTTSGTRDDSFAHAFLRETKAWNAATASCERMRSPNRWPSWSIRRVRSSGGSRKSLREVATASAGSAPISRATLRASASV